MVIASATPAAFDVRTMDFIGCGKRGSGVVVCGRVKGTLRIALRNGGAVRSEVDGAPSVSKLGETRRDCSRYARFIVADHREILL